MGINMAEKPKCCKCGKECADDFAIAANNEVLCAPCYTDPKPYLHLVRGMKLYREPGLGLLHIAEPGYRPNTTLCRLDVLEKLKLVEADEYPFLITANGEASAEHTTICGYCMESVIHYAYEHEGRYQEDFVRFVLAVFNAVNFEIKRRRPKGGRGNKVPRRGV